MMRRLLRHRFPLPSRLAANYLLTSSILWLCHPSSSPGFREIGRASCHRDIGWHPEWLWLQSLWLLLMHLSLLVVIYHSTVAISCSSLRRREIACTVLVWVCVCPGARQRYGVWLETLWLILILVLSKLLGIILVVIIIFHLRQERQQGFRQNALALSTDHFLERALRYLVFPFVPLD